MWIFYDLMIFFYGAAIRLASPFSTKAKKWLEGRKGWQGRLNEGLQKLSSSLDTDAKATDGLNPAGRKTGTVWFHCASLGEFEQGRPVIEAFRKTRPGWKIVLTFFSPSGFEVRKNYPAADWVGYLPLDTPGNARKFIAMVKPDLAIFVKYEFWFRIMDRLDRNRIPFVFISANFRPGQIFFSRFGAWSLRQLRKSSQIYVQTPRSAELLKYYGINQVTISGDTRFDRVAAIADRAERFPAVEDFCSGTAVFLAGSTWPADESIITELIRKYGRDWKFIIAPHEVGKERIESLKTSLTRAALISGDTDEPVILHSNITERNLTAARVLIIDGIGFLSHLYQYATVAYIGGGFGAGIHNILEAATFGKPVIFGPRYHKFTEALDLVECKGAFPVENARQLEEIVARLMGNPGLAEKSGEVCSEYVRQKQGATEIILRSLPA
jgi:3-deoxy-D-manno-octulosonic-acid transferase